MAVERIDAGVIPENRECLLVDRGVYTASGTARTSNSSGAAASFAIRLARNVSIERDDVFCTPVTIGLAVGDQSCPRGQIQPGRFGGSILRSVGSLTGNHTKRCGVPASASSKIGAALSGCTPTIRHNR